MIGVRDIGPNEAGTAARVLAGAFADDPVMARLVRPAARNRRAKLTELFRAAVLSSRPQDVDVARRDGSDEILGVAVWRSPAGGGPLLRAVPALLRAAAVLGPGSLLALARYDLAVRPHLPPPPYWHLVDIGVSATARGEGVGTALLNHRLGVIDARGEAVFLEATTPESRRLYERSGFQACGALTGVTAGATAMLRPAAPR
ncbi:GNAT family N-acetyltransferase [Nocardiopsis sediminis]|uniref:GNAT family N-acetyltransferase n=1 Tax=Nocardiopsis sediminis TaxID=1778267 RepID=A0ABV8FND2_9ACTN